MDRTIVSILAGLGGMLGWGTSDFLANNASEKIGHQKTFFWSQVAGLGLIAVCALLLSANFALSPLLLGLTVFLAIIYAFGYLFFYKGFEIGNVSVISAVINLQTLFVILISFFIRHQTLTTLQIPALIMIILGILLVSTNFSDLKQGSISLLKGVKETLLAAVLFGVFYWPLNEFVVEQADWLAVSLLVKLIALIVVAALSRWQKESLAVQLKSKKLWLLIGAVGVLEAAAVLAASFGTAFGDGILVAPITSALTIVTVGLAIVFNKEVVNRVQGLGILMVVGGIILTAL